MSPLISARGETLSLLRHFLRLRHQFPSKQGRSALRRLTINSFAMRQAQFDHLAQTQGVEVAQHCASGWRSNAWKDLELWNQLARTTEKRRRNLIQAITSDKLY